MRLLLGILPTAGLGADLPGMAVAVDVEIFDAAAFSPIGIAVVWALRLVPRVDGNRTAVFETETSRRFVVADRHFEHFRPIPILGAK